MSNIFFIIGVNGVGKSSIIPFLRDSLDEAAFIIHDFDERGVPNNAGKEWRESETLHWMNVGKENLKKDISTIICGFSKPAEVQSAAIICTVMPKVILLDANSEAVTQRIMSRYTTPESLVELTRTTGKTPEKFIQDNVWVSSKFREESNSLGYMILDTSDLMPNQVAEKLIMAVK